MIAITQIRANFVDPIPVLRIDPRKGLLTALQSAGIALDVLVLSDTSDLPRDCSMLSHLGRRT